jgi:hypothetical protein
MTDRHWAFLMEILRGWMADNIFLHFVSPLSEIND